MGSSATGTLDEAYERLHTTGPEFEGWLSNHGPMAAEAMVRHGQAGQVHRWLDDYMARLEEFPRGSGPIGSGWQEALGDPRRIADWTGYFQREVTEQPWRQALQTWWPRLLPGVAAAATHGVIRVGHAVRALTQDGAGAEHLAELAHGLAYWAARWQPVPGTPASEPPGGATHAPVPAGAPATGGLAIADALAAVPRIADQTGGIRDRLGRLTGLPGWAAALRAPQIPASAGELGPWLSGLVDAATTRYLRYGHGNGVMLVHSATAPNAILRTLPALDQHLWAPSVTAAWAAVAALTSIYAPAAPAAQAALPDPPDGAQAAEEAFARAVEHGDEHVIKFADTAADVFARTGDPDALAAAVRATHLIGR
ncbi:MAG TPA: questin oxidase family protein [Streptosporangiaceae bacterium]|nr:questin oxidase family protein [Streptosporangiaceae bacterium]